MSKISSLVQPNYAVHHEQHYRQNKRKEGIGYNSAVELEELTQLYVKLELDESLAK